MNLLRDWGPYMAAFYSKPFFTDGEEAAGYFPVPIMAYLSE